MTQKKKKKAKTLVKLPLLMMMELNGGINRML